MFGNVIIRLRVMLPTGMLRQLAAELQVSISVAALLVTYGALVVLPATGRAPPRRERAGIARGRTARP